MDNLFDDFSALESRLEVSLASLESDLQTTFDQIWDAAMQRTVATWKEKFGTKCPKTVEKFIAEYKQDASTFSGIKLADTRGFRSVSDYNRLFEFLKQECGSSQVLLGRMIGDEDNDSIKITSIFRAKHMLARKFEVDSHNTITLENMTDDTVSEAQYCKLLRRR